ncbi:hypothetical protein M409DRAFT_53998 [Zasmidium cellare ATCC 36951]|uniref:Uncharacterized protein n=1 Tax=Zasmidium cellare ATCC 36951 TaxID=1080233 RepID=A0A6A6CJH6_ZASCE|nr:uncharacterized protein M409DRAFT_53998 [Zasmidium cellare ATCC 36951]KAF2167394.1 hypothetical protein M409DRAFT_53998 [Zasmidium cellare ATCC 36951]
MAAYHYSEFANFEIPEFEKLEYDSMPAAQSTASSNENVDVLSSMFWLCAGSFYEASASAHREYSELSPSKTSPEYLLDAFEQHDNVRKEAKNAIPPGALAKLDPEDAKVKQALLLLRHGNCHVAGLQDMRFIVDDQKRCKAAEAEYFRQEQLALAKEYREIKREMYFHEADVTANAIADFFTYPDEWERVLARMQRDFVFAEDYFRIKNFRTRLASIIGQITPETQKTISLAHPDMKEVVEVKEQADVGLDAVWDIVPQLRKREEHRRERGRRHLEILIRKHEELNLRLLLEQTTL